MAMRFNVAKETPQLYDALLALNTAIEDFGADARLAHLIKIRVSQIWKQAQKSTCQSCWPALTWKTSMRLMNKMKKICSPSVMNLLK